MTVIQPTPCHELNQGLCFWDDSWLDQEREFHERLASRAARAAANPRKHYYGSFADWKARMNAQNVYVSIEDYLGLRLPRL